MNHTVKEYLWGYNDTLMEILTGRTKLGLFVGVSLKHDPDMIRDLK